MARLQYSIASQTENDLKRRKLLLYLGYHVCWWYASGCELRY